jgi:CO dehydrogenase/acetyl-CoA synthase beta subunit
MALFDEQLHEVRESMDGWREAGSSREYHAGERAPWPDGSTVVLEEETALELGNPSGASMSFLLWTENEIVDDGRITLVGPDVGETVERSVPFAQVVVVKGGFANEYDSYRDIRDAMYETRSRGFSVRTMPSRQSIWCRVARDAADAGFSLVDLGSSLIESLREVVGVAGAEVLFVTSSVEDVRKLSGAAAGAQRIVDAMMKMYQEENFDCETCEYQDVCDTVMDLKKIREKLADARN